MTQWPDVITSLMARQDLSTVDITWAMEQILQGEAQDAQIAAFAVALHAKGESAREVGDLLAVMRRHSPLVEVAGPTIDIVGTGGDRSGSINVSTLTSLVVAGAGARVVKHGNRAASSQCGSADVLAALDITIDLPPHAIAPCLDRAGIAFCFAPVFHPALRFAGPARKAVGVPTVFNILGPLANPARPTAALIGVSFADMIDVVTGVLADAGVAALVVRGHDGLDEIALEGATDVWEVRAGRREHSTITAAQLGLAPAPLAAVRGGDAAANARIGREVLAGTPGPARDIVVANAAAAWAAWLAVTELDVAALPDRLADGVAVAQESLDSGAAAAVLEKWIGVSRDLGSGDR